MCILWQCQLSNDIFVKILTLFDLDSTYEILIEISEIIKHCKRVVVLLFYWYNKSTSGTKFQSREYNDINTVFYGNSWYIR